MIHEIVIVVFCAAFINAVASQSEFQYENGAKLDDGSMDMLGGHRKWKLLKHGLKFHKKFLNRRGHHRGHHFHRNAYENEPQPGHPALQYAYTAQPPFVTHSGVGCGTQILISCAPNIQIAPCGQSHLPLNY